MKLRSLLPEVRQSGYGVERDRDCIKQEQEQKHVLSRLIWGNKLVEKVRHPDRIKRGRDGTRRIGAYGQKRKGGRHDIVEDSPSALNERDQ